MPDNIDTPFQVWVVILEKVVEMMMSNWLTSIMFYTLVISIFVSVVAALFNKDGSRKDNG